VLKGNPESRSLPAFREKVAFDNVELQQNVKNARKDLNELDVREKTHRHVRSLVCVKPESCNFTLNPVILIFVCI